MFMLYVHVCAHVCRHPRGLEKGIGFPGTGVIGDCERPSVRKNWGGSVCFNHRAVSPDSHKDLKRHFWERCSEVRRQGCFYCTSDLNNRNLLSYFWRLKVRNQDGGWVGSLKAMWKGLLRPLSMCTLPKSVSLLSVSTKSVSLLSSSSLQACLSLCFMSKCLFLLSTPILLD